MGEDRVGLLIGDQGIGAPDFLVSVGGQVLPDGGLVRVTVDNRPISLRLILVSDVPDYFLNGAELPDLAVFAYDAGNRRSFVNLARHFAHLRSCLALREPSDLPLLLLVTRPGGAVPAAEARRFALDHLDMVPSGGLADVVARALEPPFFSGRLALPVSANVRYRIRSRARPELAFDISGAAKDAGASLTVCDANYGPNQQFLVGQTIVSVNSGMALTAEDGGRIVQMPHVGAAETLHFKDAAGHFSWVRSHWCRISTILKSILTKK